MESAVEQILFGAGEGLDGAEITGLGISGDGARCEEAVASELELFGPLERIAGVRSANTVGSRRGEKTPRAPRPPVRAG